MPDGVTVHALEAGVVSEMAKESTEAVLDGVLLLDDPAFFSVLQAPAAATATTTRASVRTMISAE